MAFDVKKGSFTCNTSPGNQVISGTGFTPKALIFWTSLMTAEGFSVQNRGAIGLVVSTSARRYYAWASNDAADPTNVGGRSADLAIGMLSAVSTVDGEADFVSFEANGFTLNWTDAPSSAWIVHYIALGGSDLTNVFLKTFNSEVLTGNKAYTGVGFLPDCLVSLGAHTGTTLPSTTATGLSPSIGFGLSSTARHVAGFGDQDNVATSNAASYLYASRVLAIANMEDSENTLADIVSLDADGFTLNYTSVIGSARPVAVLCLKGGQYKVGVETQKTSGGTKATTGVGFQPTGMLCIGADAVADTLRQENGGRLVLGGASSGAEGTSWFNSQDATGTAETDSSTTTAKVLRHATPPSTIDAEADLSSFDSGGFTLDWTTADATAREFAYLAFGSTAAGATVQGGLTLIGVG